MTLTMTKTIFVPNYEFVVDSFGNESCIIYLCNGSIAVDWAKYENNHPCNYFLHY